MRLKYLVTYYFISRVFCSILPEDFNENYEAAQLTGAIRTISKFWITHDVILLSHPSSYCNKVDHLTSSISKILLPLHPMQQFETTDLSMFTENDHMVASSRTFCILVYDATLTEDTALIQHHLHRTSHLKHSPKTLIVFIGTVNSTQSQYLLKYLWGTGFPYVVSLEVPEDDRTIIVHSYKLQSSYLRSEYDGDVSNWYTDKFRDLSGIRFKLCRLDNSRVQDEMLNVHLEMFQEMLNVSLNVTTITGTVYRCDMVYSLVYLVHTKYYSNSTEHTSPVFVDKFCLFIPPMTRKGSAGISWGLLFAFVVGVLIVGMVWAFSSMSEIRLFERPFNIVAVILGLALNSMWRSSRLEKILYVCLVQVATRYTSMLYTELFSETAASQKEPIIENFEDLYGLDLTIRVKPSLYTFFSDKTNRMVPTNLLHMFEQTEDIREKIPDSMRRKNVGYFSMQLLEIFLNKSPQRATMKRTKLCVGSVSAVHQVPLRWMYKERVNDLIWRINEYGFREREYSLRDRTATKHAMMEQIVDNSTSQRRMVMALLYGYLVVMIVFFGELLVDYVRSRKRSRRCDVGRQDRPRVRMTNE